MSTTPQVYAAINAVQAELASVGISKDRRNTQGAGYNFRGIDDIYNALAPLLAKHKLVILPRATSRQQEVRETKSGGALYYTTVHMEFDFVSAVDGSKHTVATYGEAMDSSDKSTNKSMSAAFKYAAFQALCIPTEGDNDADAHTHEVAPPKPAKAKETPKAEPPFVPMKPETEKALRFLAESPKGKKYVEEVIHKKGYVGVDDFSEEIAQKTIKWAEEQLAKEAKS